MSRLVGEDIYIIGAEGRVLVPNAVVSPQSGTVVVRNDGQVIISRYSVLIPLGYSVEFSDKIEVRGVEHFQESPAETSISPFGTGRGGTEIFLEKPQVG